MLFWRCFYVYKLVGKCPNIMFNISFYDEWIAYEHRRMDVRVSVVLVIRFFAIKFQFTN